MAGYEYDMRMGMDDSWHNAGADPMFNDPAAASPSGGGFSGAEWASFGGSVTGLVSGALGMKSTSLDIEAANEVLMTNLESRGESMAFSQSVRSQQAKDLAKVTSNQMSAVAYNQMVEEATAKAVGAESGSTGASEEEKIAQTEVNANFQMAKVQEDYRTRSASMLLQSSAELMSFENMQESMLSQQLDPMNAALKVASAGMSGFASGQRLFS